MNCRIFSSPIQLSNAVSQKPRPQSGHYNMTTFMLIRHSSAEGSLRNLWKCQGPTRMSAFQACAAFPCAPCARSFHDRSSTDLKQFWVRLSGAPLGRLALRRVNPWPSASAGEHPRIVRNLGKYRPSTRVIRVMRGNEKVTRGLPCREDICPQILRLSTRG